MTERYGILCKLALGSKLSASHLEEFWHHSPSTVGQVEWSGLSHSWPSIQRGCILWLETPWQLENKYQRWAPSRVPRLLCSLTVSPDCERCALCWILCGCFCLSLSLCLCLSIPPFSFWQATWILSLMDWPHFHSSFTPVLLVLSSMWETPPSLLVMLVNLLQEVSTKRWLPKAT